MVHWLERLAARGIIRPGSNMMEFGPQDFDTPDTVVAAVAKRLLAEHRAAQLLPRALDALARRRKQYHADFYALYGISSYHSLDPFDEYADYRYDLNYFVPIFRKYDVVTNFGTSEHVFETARVYRTAHRLLKTDGVLLLVQPAFGDIDHGFFNVHPVLYRTMAQHSGYELCDLQYIDDIAVRTRAQCATPTERFDFDHLPIQLRDMADEAAFKRKVMMQFVRNGQQRLNVDGAQLPDVFDYCFVALRKIKGGRMLRPYQYSDRPPSSLVNVLAALSLVSVRNRIRRTTRRALDTFKSRIPTRAKNAIRRVLGRQG